MSGSRSAQRAAWALAVGARFAQVGPATGDGGVSQVRRSCITASIASVSQIGEAMQNITGYQVVISAAVDEQITTTNDIPASCRAW